MELIVTNQKMKFDVYVTW